MHRFLFVKGLRLFNTKLRFIIETKATPSKNFAHCENSECRKTFIIASNDIVKDDGLLLCSYCRKKLVTHHIVQCSNCQTAVNFIPSDVEDIPLIYFVEKCSHCTGTTEDEKHISINHFPEAFI